MLRQSFWERDKMYKTVLKIDGMMCGMCEAHICDAIRKEVPSASKVKATRAKGEASFLTKDEVDTDKIRKAVNSTGYTCTSAECDIYVKKGLFG